MWSRIIFTTSLVSETMELSSNQFKSIDWIRIIHIRMIEIIKHTLGICGEHFHPNIWTAMASSPIILTTVHYIKCKCGGWFKHKKDCKNDLGR